MPENIIIQPNRPLFVKLSDPMNTDNFNFETREGKFETSTGQTLTLPRPAVQHLYALEPGPGEELEILKKWSGKRGEPAIWSIRRAQTPTGLQVCPQCHGFDDYCADVATCETCKGLGHIKTASTPGETPVPDSPSAAGEPVQEAPAPIRRPSRQPATRESQPGLFDTRGNGTYGPMPAGVAYAAPRLVPRRPAGEVIPWNVAFREVSQWVAQELRGNRLQWSDEAQQAMVCTVLIAEAKKGRIGPWQR